MELEELKQRNWLKEIKYSRAELESIFEVRTKSSVKDINRKMLLDALFMLLTTSILILVTFLLGLKSRYLISGQIIGFALLLLMHYKIKYIMLNRVSFHKDHIRKGIIKVYSRLRNYVVAYYIIVPLFVLTLLTKTRSDLGYDFDINGLLLSLIALFSSLIVTHLLVKILYRKDLERLMAIVKNLG